jgi:hypothetical protein
VTCLFGLFFFGLYAHFLVDFMSRSLRGIVVLQGRWAESRRLVARSSLSWSWSSD